MPDIPSNASTAARRVELAIARLDFLSTLPSVAARLFSKLLQGRFSPSGVADIIEADPALTVGMFAIIGRRRMNMPSEKFSLRQALDRLPADVVRDAVLSVKVSRDLQIPEILSKKDLFLHSLAVACCAESIAQIAPARIDPQLAYAAGLLHDIGKLALQDAMPKSFARLVEQAKSAQSSSLAVERRQLGADHTILGRRLAQKWRLPEEIALTVWLHHSDTAAIAQDMPLAAVAQIVQLADSIARQSGIGQSGSYDSPESVEENAHALGVDIGRLEQIARNLLTQVAEKSNLLGLDSPDALADYGDAAGAAAAHLAARETELTAENRKLQAASSHLDFAADFLASIDPAADVMDVAESFAVRWQTFYQTGSVCLYLAPPPGTRTIDAAVVESLGQSSVVSLDAPDQAPAVPSRIAGEFAILDAHDHIDWLFDQLNLDFSPGATKLLPLLSNNAAVGAIAFELHYPGDAALFEEKFKTSSSIAGIVLDLALSGVGQQSLAERFAQLVSGYEQVAPSQTEEIPSPAASIPARSEAIEALAELAAGAAHELNNPLAVVSGRAQLLADAETEPDKKNILSQIHDAADRACAVIEDLMGFAEPPRPRPAKTDVRSMIDEALQLAARKTNAEHINVQVEVADNAKEVFADSAQIASVVANIVTNAVESYRGELGPIKIAASPTQPDKMVKLQVMDLGCGMDAQAVKKAAQPFYSAKIAGRKRGMGLAYAARFVQINGGTLDIESSLGVGTTVTILLPRA
ncbi:MAG: HDOD domain-containing protein [Sedimentisphaerales bacterium]|nr:HDOD domain-containing protein [Sedimentisphaerales bacterium]